MTDLDMDLIKKAVKDMDFYACWENGVMVTDVSTPVERRLYIDVTRRSEQEILTWSEATGTIDGEEVPVWIACYSVWFLIDPTDTDFSLGLKTQRAIDQIMANISEDKRVGFTDTTSANQTQVL